MILVHRYQQQILKSPEIATLGGTLSLTNVKAETSDQDPFFLGKTQTMTKTRQEHHDQDGEAGETPAVFPR